MPQEYDLLYVDKPEETAWGIIGRGIHNFNEQIAGDNHFQRLCYAVVTAEGEIVGGIFCAIHWDWLYIDLLWLPEALRGQGYGHRLLEAAEDEARRRGARNAYLDTFSFQAPDFYRRHGYRVFGELQDFPPGHTRYYLTKQL
jgi:GNAT superfamily N-acetyltransferase